jgi:hypothetical protein
MQVGHHASRFSTPLPLSFANYAGFWRQLVQRLEGPPPAFFLFDSFTASMFSPEDEEDVEDVDDMVIVECGCEREITSL